MEPMERAYVVSYRVIGMVHGKWIVPAQSAEQAASILWRDFMAFYAAPIGRKSVTVEGERSVPLGTRPYAANGEESPGQQLRL